MQDVEFMTAKEKVLTLKAWTQFVKAAATGAELQMQKAFTKRLYLHLINHCEFIAHYNRGGFFSTYFEEPSQVAHFFAQFDKLKGCLSIEYGMTHWLTMPDYTDINHALVDAAGPYLEAIYAKANTEQKELDIARARTLLAKHGLGA
tara:strand:+ start:42 stop:482 length:441 start_codon:yes stop_codon:yes gene_type:complete